MPPKKGTKKAQAKSKSQKADLSDDDASGSKLSLDLNAKLGLNGNASEESEEEAFPVQAKKSAFSFAALGGDDDNQDAEESDDGGGLMGAIQSASKAKANDELPSGKKDKKKKKASRVHHTGFTDDEEDAQNLDEPKAETKGPVVVSAEDLFDDDEPQKKTKKKGGKKGKKDALADAEDEMTKAETIADEGAAPAPSAEPAAANDEDNEDGDDAPKHLSKKEKEKLKKQRQKEKEKAKKKSTADISASPLPSTNAEEPVAATEEPVADEGADEDAADGAGAASSKNKKKKKKPAAKEETAAAEPAKGKGGKVSKQVLAMREALLAKQAAEAAQAAAEAAERQRIEDEERKEREEKERIEAARLAKKQKQKEKEAQQKASGTFKTPAQRKEEARQEAQRQALIASGVKIAGLEEKSSGQAPKKVVYSSKKKGPAKQTGPRELPTVTAPSGSVSVQETAESVPEVKEEPAPVSTAPAAEDDVKADWDADSDEDKDKADVKDSWDAESEPEADPVPKPAQKQATPASSAVVKNGITPKSAPQPNGKPASKPSQQITSNKTAQVASPKAAAPPARKAAPAKRAEASESSEEESSDDDSEEDSDDSDDDSDDSDDSSDEEERISAAKQLEMKKKAEAAIRKKARIEAAMAARSKDDLRSPICCILGHVDTGKTKLLDKIRQTNVQEGEAGGITQQIGATFFPVDAIVAKTAVLGEDNLKEYKLPGLLVIDTPGHESFTNLRSRGSSLCNIAILVVDIVHGLEPQTLESLRMLRDKKTPFIVALNKIDRCYGWKAIPNAGFKQSLANQTKSTQAEFQDRLQKTIVAFAEQGLNALPWYENKDVGRVVSLVPTSAVTGEGVPDMLMLITKLTQERMSGNLMYLSEMEATVLEVKVIEGLGTTIDVVLSNGVLHEGDKIIVCGLNGAISTQIRALLTPQPLKEMRIKGSYVHHKEVKASLGVKIVAPDLEKAIAGSRMLVLTEDDDEDELKKDIMQDLTSLLNSVDRTGKGVWVQASTLGALEALLDFLKSSKIPVAGINIGPVHKKDIMRASTMLERAPEYAVCLCFDVEIDKDAERLANEVGMKLFKADIIYHLFDAFTAHNAAMVEAKQRDSAPQAVWPCRLKILACFAKRDPIILGCDLLDGTLRIGTPLCCVKRDPETNKKEVISLGKITSLEINHKPFQRVSKAQVGAGVAIKIEHAVYESAKMFGRHFDDKDEIYSMVSRTSIDTLKNVFRDEVAKEDWQLIVKLKGLLDIA